MAAAHIGHQFTDYEVARMKELLGAPAPPPPDATVASHVDHCFAQLHRYADRAEKGGDFCALQFGLNLGRAQELLGSHGGPGAWWVPFGALAAARNWAAVKGLVVAYCDALGRPRPQAG